MSKANMSKMIAEVSMLATKADYIRATIRKLDAVSRKTISDIDKNNITNANALLKTISTLADMVNEYK